MGFDYNYQRCLRNYNQEIVLDPLRYLFDLVEFTTPPIQATWEAGTEKFIPKTQSMCTIVDVLQLSNVANRAR